MNTTYFPLKFGSPDVVLKELAIQKTGDFRRLRLSTNFLPLFGFETGTRFEINTLPNFGGLRMTYQPEGSHKIHQRRYAKRKNNPLETQIDIQGQKMLDAAIPNYTERVHFTIKKGEILVTPLANRTFSIRKYLKDSNNPFNTFVGMTSGVDIHCLKKIGFNIDTILEYRPNEARDNTDLTETGIVNALANSTPRVVLNQNIYNIDWNYAASLINLPAIGLIHLSPQCDDFSNIKANSLKEKSVVNLDTTRDMFMDCLRAIEITNSATVIIENVPGFATSNECELMRLRLRRMGYFVSDGVFDARDYGGLTSRKRFYLVASIWPDFEFPENSSRQENKVWTIVEKHINNCRDVSHTNSISKGMDTGRIRIINKNSDFAPTITKSQNRQAKDSVYIEKGGQYFLPNEELMRELMGMPDDLCLNSVGATVASEIIGQSIEYPLHHSIAKNVYDHIAKNTGSFVLSTYCKKYERSKTTYNYEEKTGQFSLF